MALSWSARRKVTSATRSAVLDGERLECPAWLRPSESVMSPAASSASISAAEQPNCGQDFAAVLADQRRGAVDGRRRLAHLHRRRDHPHRASLRVLVARDHLHVRDLRIFGGLAEIVDLGAPDVGGEQSRSRRSPRSNFRVSALTFSQTSSRLANRVGKVVIDGKMRRFERLVEGLVTGSWRSRCTRRRGSRRCRTAPACRDGRCRSSGRTKSSPRLSTATIFLAEMGEHAGEQIDLDLLALAGLLPVIERGTGCHRPCSSRRSGRRARRRPAPAAGRRARCSRSGRPGPGSACPGRGDRHRGRFRHSPSRSSR